MANSVIKMELTIELASKKDAPCVAKIEEECFSVPFKEKDILSYLENPIWHFLVAKSKGEIVGYISFTIILDECQIVNVATSRAHRKMGVGKALVSALLDFAKSNEASKLFLEVRKSNEPAIMLYRKYGFDVVGVSRNHYFSPTEDALLMNLEI